ncbi:hypothetical protein BH23ACT9_BH23ACT9_28760 [soil metagenome]
MSRQTQATDGVPRPDAGIRAHGSRGGLALLLTLLMAIIALAPAPGAAAGPDPLRPDVPTSRLAGADRITTAIEVSRHGWAAAEVALLATTDSFPDALAGSALARRFDAPVLLTPAHGLPSAVAAELLRLGVQRVVLLGGPAAITDAVADAVRALETGPVVERIAGTTRYETAAAIADAAALTTRTIALTSGETFADALAASSLVATGEGAPILLTAAAGLPEATRQALIGLQDSGADQVVIVGGPAAVSTAVEEAVTALGFDVLRLAGPSRYETAMRVLDHVLDGELAGTDARSLVITTGERFPDALAAGALTLREGAVFVTVPSASWPEDLHRGLRRHAAALDALLVVGGEGAVSTHVVDGVVRAVGDAPFLDNPVDPLGLALEPRYGTAFTQGEDPWSVWVCHIPTDTADTTIGPDRLPVDIQHVQAAAEALTPRWASVVSAGRWQPTFTVGGEVTVAAEESWVRGGCLYSVLEQLPRDTPVQGLLVVLDAVGGVAVGGAFLYDTCDEERCTLDRSVHGTLRHAVLPADSLAPFGDGTTSLVVLAHELGHAMGWPHVYRQQAASDQYEDPMDLMAAAAGWTDGEWIVAPGTMAFNRYAAGWIDAADVAVHRGGTAAYEVTALGSPGVQLLAIPGTEPGALVTVESRVWDGIDRGVPTEGVQVGIVDQRGYPCGADPGTSCAGYRRLSPAMGRPGSADHVLHVGEGADVLGLRIDVIARRGSTFTVTVSGGQPDIPHFEP